MMSRTEKNAEHKSYYDQRWDGFQYANRLRLARCTAILECLQATRIFEPRIIDLGCGSGWLTSILGVFGPAVGVDLSSHAVAQASKQHMHVSYRQADILSMAIEDSSYDIVVSQEVLEHIPDQKRYLEIAGGLLRPGGFLILTTPNLGTFERLPKAQRDEWGQQPLENKVTLAQLRMLLREAGFDVLRCTSIVPGYGLKGVFRILGSRKLAGAFDCIMGNGAFDRLSGRAGSGLHLLAFCQKSVQAAPERANIKQTGS